MEFCPRENTTTLVFLNNRVYSCYSKGFPGKWGFPDSTQMGGGMGGLKNSYNFEGTGHKHVLSTSMY